MMAVALARACFRHWLRSSADDRGDFRRVLQLHAPKHRAGSAMLSPMRLEQPQLAFEICDDVIMRAHVSRKRKPQANAPTGH